MASKIRLVFPLSLIILLSACQQNPSPRQQKVVNMEQIATVVAASQWIKGQCDRSDIPAQDTLVSNALVQGGVSSEEVDRQTLMQAINQRYDAIDRDGQTRSQKCAALNASLAPFLQKIK